jgi:hypothetical protein
LIRPDIVRFAPGETGQEDGSSAPPICHQHPKTARSPPPHASDALFDQSAAKIRVDKATLRPLDRLDQVFVRDPLAPGIPAGSRAP